MHAASSMLLNALKLLAELPGEMDLLGANVIDSIRRLKQDLLNGKTPSLDLEETLIALSVSAPVNPAALLAMEKLPELRGCEVHLSHIPSPGDEVGLRRLGANVTAVVIARMTRMRRRMRVVPAGPDTVMMQLVEAVLVHHGFPSRVRAHRNDAKRRPEA